MNIPQFPADKAQHFCYGALIAFLAGGALTLSKLPHYWVSVSCFASAAAFGLAKEAYDWWSNRKSIKSGAVPTHGVSFGDFLATVLGGVAVGAF